MTDKVQKIREEVVRIHNLLPVMDGDNISINYADRICTTLEMYIDSLQEKQVNESTKIQHVKETCKENGNSLTQEPVSKIIFDGNFNKSWFAHPELAFKAGMKEMREQMMKEAIERTVKIDAGGYPYIDCDGIELYDYDKDVPLAKEGKKVKVIVIKE